MFKLNRYKPYIPFARNVFQRLISYKANVLFFMFGDLLMLAVTYYLWKAIYESSNESILNGFGFNEMIIYIFISFITSVMISVDISHDISREVKDGSIAINLVRPLNYEKRMLFQGLGSILYNFIVIFIITFSITTILYYKFFGYVSIVRILLYFFSVIIGIFIHDHKSPRTAIEHQPFLVFARGIGQTKNAGIGLGPENVFNAPRRPKLFHDQTSIHRMGGGSKR